MLTRSYDAHGTAYEPYCTRTEVETMVGIGNAGVVDLVTQGADGEVALIIVGYGRWSGTRAEADALLAKLNGYARYVLEGGLVEAYPQAAGQRVRIQLDCDATPSTAAREVLAAMASALSQHSIELRTNLLEEKSP